MPLPVYADLPTLQGFITKVANVDSGLLTLALSVASRSIDDYCQRRFYLDTATSQRLYDTAGRVMTPAGQYPYQGLSGVGYAAYGGYGGTVLLVDDIASSTGLVVETGSGTTWVDVTANVTTLPLNAAVFPEAITAIGMLNGWTSSPYSQVRVTATWGWPVVPDVISYATLIQASRLYKRKDSPEGVLGSADWGGVVRVGRIDPDVQSLVQPYVIYQGFA